MSGRSRLRARRALLAAAALSWLAPSGAALAQAPKTPIRIDEPPPGKAQIVFFRKGEWSGGIDSYMIRDGDVEVGRIYSGSYFVLTVAPGLHGYMVRAEKKDTMQIVVEAGEIYYVYCELGAGVILYQPTLTPSEEWLFDRMSPGLKLVPPKTPN